MLKSLSNLKVVASYIELASKGVSQKTWDSWNESERADYLKRVPNSKYADPNNTLPTQIKPVKNIPELESETIQKLNKCIDGTWKINSDGTIDVDGNVDLDKSGLAMSNVDCYCLGKLQVQFNKVNGNFICNKENFLDSLNGFPKEVTGNCFIENQSHLKNLIGGPEIVGGRFDCSSCEKLTSLKGAPKIIGGDTFFTFNRSLKSLMGFPKEIDGNLHLGRCGKEFTKEEIISRCNVKGKLLTW